MVHQLIYITSVVMSITGGFLQAPGVADSAEFGSRIPGALQYLPNKFVSRYGTYLFTYQIIVIKTE